VRVLAIDVGRRRIGLAISDSSATLARPLTTIVLSTGDALGVDRVAAEIERVSAELAGDAEHIETIVVGVPVRLDGSPDEETAKAAAFVAGLRARLAIPVTTEDERLSSREAESRLAVTERDWRKRKANLDAAAAAVILQDYLDRVRSTS
jgi:putative holliday junction resolvase